jgi:predicted dehydrogenase
LWRVNWDTGGGAIADMGAHYFEAAQWARGDLVGAPVEYEGVGLFRGDGGINNTPYFYNVRARYADGTLLIMDPAPKGVRFDGEEGSIHISDAGEVTAQPASVLAGLAAREKLPAPNGHWNIMAPHIRNFLDAIRSRQLTVSHPEVAQRAHTIIHCANLCLRLGRRLRWDAAAERFAGDEEANGMIARPMRAPWRI